MTILNFPNQEHVSKENKHSEDYDVVTCLETNQLKLISEVFQLKMFILPLYRLFLINVVNLFIIN